MSNKMSDELRAAIEGLRECKIETVRHMGAAGIVAAAYLAEHPADDDEPVTEEWLKSIGFVSKEEWAAWITGDWCDQCILLFRSSAWPKVWSMQYENDFHWPHDLRTRGHIRLVCKVLGIKLKASVPA